uniref:F-box protein interaction domain n=1 Tax=Medicago truncatula TaxID=3880 RepID=A2Q607_MEDTR|nr:F-box protein interaction domain [Medicago truncatula]
MSRHSKRNCPRGAVYEKDSESSASNVSLVLGDDDISHKLFWEIYSLRSSSWRKFDVDHVPHNYSENGMCHDGVCHWLGENRYDSKYESYLLSFDLSNEIFLITPMPSEIDSLYVGYRWKGLLTLNGFFALISACAEYDTFHISVLGELGMKESWIKLDTVYLLSYIERPINARKNIYRFAAVMQGILVSTDSSTLMIEELGYVGRHTFLSKTIFYKGSNLLIEGINQ